MAVRARKQFSVLSFSSSQVEQVFSPPGDLGPSAHHHPLLSSSL